MAQLETWARAHGWAAPNHEVPLPGDLACLGGEHVTIVQRLLGAQEFNGLGGNQGNMVKVSVYPVSRITTLVRPPQTLTHETVPAPATGKPTWEVVRGEGKKPQVVFTSPSLDAALGRASTLLHRGVWGLKIRKRRSGDRG